MRIRLIRRVGGQIVPGRFHQLQLVRAGQGFEREQGLGLYVVRGCLNGSASAYRRCHAREPLLRAQCLGRMPMWLRNARLKWLKLEKPTAAVSATLAPR